ncbi:histone-lysine N-methyltransferase, H3 lysine-79 specific-like isoform X2 [Symsagittifera roscoffensis]|uniref:histone-lysine N-methyltransferase, H3 lysine-79 specific-like isoform X2 n=1 Tax=Symsagittifera roscoffensis TaxID=84072 RepID=UPI00307C759A
MDTRPKTSRGIPAYGSAAGFKPPSSASGGSRLSTDELLRRASGHLKEGGPARGSAELATGGGNFRVTSSYDPAGKVRSSTETYLNNLSRKASKASQDISDEEVKRKAKGKKKPRGRVSSYDSDEKLHSEGDTSSSTTIGKGGASFLKKKPAPQKKAPSNDEKLTAKAGKPFESSGLMSSSDEQSEIVRRNVVRGTGQKPVKIAQPSPEKSDDKSIDINMLLKDELSMDNSSTSRKRLTINRQSNVDQDLDEEYDQFDMDSPPKTPVSARKEVRFSTQLSIASGEDNMSVVESVMDTESIQADFASNLQPTPGASSSSVQLGVGGASVGKSANLFQDSDLEMEVNLGIEDILPATVKPDKTLPDSASEEDPFDALGQNLLDINELSVANSDEPPKPVARTKTKRQSRSARRLPRLSSFRTSSRSSTTSASEDDVVEEIVSENEVSSATEKSVSSHGEQLLAAGKLPETKGRLLIMDNEESEQKNDRGKSKKVDKTEKVAVEDAYDDSRRESMVSMYSQDSFDDVSTTEPPYSDQDQAYDSESDITLPENQEKLLDEVKAVKRHDSSGASVTSYDSDSDVTTSFPSYTNAESKKESNRKHKSPRSREQETKMKGVHVDSKAGHVTVGQEYFAERETETSIDRVFHQIVTIQPKSIASMVVEKETIESMTSYNPSAVALTTFMSNHLKATRTFIENTRKLHEQYQKLLIPTYHYTSLEDTKQVIKERKEKQRRLSLEESIDRVEQQMGKSFSEKKRKKIREKIKLLQTQREGPHIELEH